MHYQNGREVKIGDSVVGKDHGGNVTAGIVVGMTPGAQACNIKVVPANQWATYTAGEFLHADDAFAPKPQ